MQEHLRPESLLKEISSRNNHTVVLWFYEGVMSLKQNQQKLINQDLVQIKSQPAITCSKLAIETLEKGVKYVQS